MKNEDLNKMETRNIENLANEQIEGQKIMGGGVNTGNVDYFSELPPTGPDLAPAMDSLGYDTTVIPLEEPISGNGINITTAPPIADVNNFTANGGFHGGNI
jgi:hypothetical protein